MIKMTTFLIILAFCVVIAVCGEIQKSKDEKEKQRKIKEERDWYEKVKNEQEQTRRELERQAEMRLKEKKKKGAADFNERLNRIPKIEIALSDQALSTDFEIDPEFKTSKPRKNMKRSAFGNFTVIDVETTGLGISSEIIELSAIKYKDFFPVSAFTTLINPDKVIPFEINELTGIDDCMVSDAPKIQRVMPAFVEYVGKDNLLGHNIEFDLKFLEKYGFNYTAVKRKYYDTLEIAKSKLKKETDYSDGDVENYKLPTLCEHFDIFRNDAHRSLSDCYATAILFKYLLDLYELKEDE